jgi:hypothetical protein
MPDQGLRHLQSDVAAADDHSSFDPAAVQSLADLQAALEGVYTADLDGIRTGQVRTEGEGAGGDQQLAIGLPPGNVAEQVADANFPPCRINFLNFMVNSDVNPFPFPKLFRSADNERIFLVDNPADIVGNPSGGIGGMRAALEDDNLQLRTMTFGLCGGAHPCGIAADNNQFCLAHLSSSNEELRLLHIVDGDLHARYVHCEFGAG